MVGQTVSLRRYALTRLFLLFPMVLALLTIVFLLMRVAPGDPISAAVGGHITPAELEKRREAAGFNRPLVVQYFEYLSDVARLDLGITITDKRPVTSVIRRHDGATLELTLAALVVAILVGVTVGLVAGRLRDSPTDLSARLFGVVIYAAPVFFLGFLGQLIFATDDTLSRGSSYCSRWSSHC